MKIRVFVYCLIVLLFFGFPSRGQEGKELTAKMEAIFQILKPADRKALTEGYMATMTSPGLSDDDKALIAAVFQDLQDLHVTVTPELKNYILCVNHFSRRGEKSNLLVWLGGMQKALASTDRKRTVVKSYLESTTALACDRMLFNGSSHQWQVKGDINWHAGKPVRIDFRDGDLVCMTRKDTIRVTGTGGVCLLGTDVLDAEGGTVDWGVAGKQMSAELSRYRVNLKTSGYTADSVRFHYEEKYDFPLLGHLKDNALKYARSKDVVFPEFSSYRTDIQLKDIYEHVSFRGGITYRSDKFSGTGTAEHPALLQIAPNDTISMNLYSKQFLFDSVRIMSGHSAMEIVMDSGQITHSDINFQYLVPTHTVTIKRISEQSSHLPFKDTYHQILFDMEEIYWPVDSTYMEMRMSSRSGLFKATIESLNFFNDNVYDNIQGMDEINPLNGLLKCSMELDSKVFTISDYAGYIRKPADQLRKQIILLSYNDFVDFNEAKDEVTLKQRLFDYTKARVGKQDYDNIRFNSQPGKARANAVLDVRNYNLRITGVEKFMISEARNIFVEPSDKQVVMLRNRDMAFNGKLNAGMFDMYGRELFFSYDKYSVVLPKVDSASMYTAGRENNVRGRKVGSLIRDITGEIVIDKPDNKSGKKEDPGYPVLNSDKDSYVFFDEPAIQGGKYKRDSFYYRIKPYKIQGINDASRFRYAFDGTLVSNIVSPINDTLRLLDDNALGLTYRTPAAGLELYGKGRIHSEIKLNKQGFLAKGKVDMNHSQFNSDTILMLPKEMSARTQEIAVNAVNARRPAAHGKNVLIKYLPESGNLQATSTAAPFDIYDGRVKHEGSLLVYENLLDASGKLELEGASMRSKLFNLQAANILSKSTALNISSVLNKDIRLNTSDVTATIDLTANKGKFVNNTKGNRAEFASSRYSCSFENFIWYMKDGYLNIGVEDPALLAKMWKTEHTDLLPSAGRNLFVSTNRLLDSLSFVAPLARYDLQSGEIACHWVNHIDVANGRFYPEKGDVFIHANGDIREFKAGTLLCERTDTAKMLTNVEFKLKGRNEFNGSGDYKYVSEERKESTVRFTEIGADTSKLIYAKAALEEDAPLALNEGLKFKGQVVLYSRQPDFYFAGYVGLTVVDTCLDHSWVTVKDYLSADHVQIPLKVENRNDKQQRIFNGIYLNTDKSFKPYAAFLSKRLFYNDDLLAGGQGKMEWAPGIKQYVISDTLKDRYYRFRYDPEVSTITSNGVVNLDLKIPGMYQKMAGVVSYELKKEKLDIRNVLYLMDFTILNRMEGVILKDFADKKLKTIGTNAGLQEKIYEICGKERMPAAEKQLKSTTGNVPDSLNRLFVLDSLNLAWNDKTRSYVADGPVNVIAIKGRPVEKIMNVKMELLRSRAGNQYFMYIYDDNMWYYFEYSDQNLYTLSSNPEYNEIIKTEKADKKVVQTKEKETLYTITLCPESKKERFLKRVN